MHALLVESTGRRSTGCSCRILRHLCKYPAHVNDFSLACGIIMSAVGLATQPVGLVPQPVLPRTPLTNVFSQQK